jgi:hypothetical protein
LVVGSNPTGPTSFAKQVLRLRSGYCLPAQMPKKNIKFGVADYKSGCSKSAIARAEEKGECVATTNVGFPKTTDNIWPGNILTWTVTILACAYIVWMGTMLYMSTSKFIYMYSSMGFELPLSTRIVIATYRFGYPIFFGGITALLIAKQFYVREKWPNLSVTLASVVMVVIIDGGIVRALYRPLFDAVEKLNK